jgi:hypothetical protein
MNPGSGTVYTDARTGDFSGFQRVYSFGGDVNGQNVYSSDGWGLVTGFEVSPATTPLPAAFPLFGTGLGALALFACNRKRKRATV